MCTSHTAGGERAGLRMWGSSFLSVPPPEERALWQGGTPRQPCPNRALCTSPRPKMWALTSGRGDEVSSSGSARGGTALPGMIPSLPHLSLPGSGQEFLLNRAGQASPPWKASRGIARKQSLSAAAFSKGPARPVQRGSGLRLPLSQGTGPLPLPSSAEVLRWESRGAVP